MSKGIGLALLVVGTVLVIYGMDTLDSASPDISQMFTGTPTNKTLWLLLCGCATTIAGAVMTSRASRKV